MKKKIISLLSCGMMVLSLVGCGRSKTDLNTRMSIDETNIKTINFQIKFKIYISP